MIDIKCPFCGLTDHGSVAGHLDFDKAMRKRGLNPVFGAELYHGTKFGSELGTKEGDQAHLIALAMTDEGLRNLWRLVNCTSDRNKFHKVGRVSNDDIVKYKEGVIFTSACPLGLVARGLLKGETDRLNWYLDNLGDNFFIELSTYPGDSDWSDMDSDLDKVTPRIVNELLLEAAQERGVPITYGDDGHYARPDQFPEHNMYLAMQTGQSIYTPVEERKMYHPENAVCIKDLDMVRDHLSYLDESVVEEAISNTWNIGEKANAHLPTADKPHLPVFVPKDCPWVESLIENPSELFIDLVKEGIERIYGGTEREGAAWERAIKEMEVFLDDGLENYFLMAWDLMQFCEKEGIDKGPGRGSAAGCIVAYALGITEIDPLHYDLYFERFWNQGRADGFPDIDSDFAPSRREDIRNYLEDRWGKHRVVSIGTVVRLKPIQTTNKLAKGCGISIPEAEELKAIVERTPQIDIYGTDQVGWNPELEPGKVVYVKDSVGKQIDKWVGTNLKRNNYVKMCEETCSRNSNYGVHASGIVVSDIDLDDYAPAYLRGGKKEGIPATLFPMKAIEELRLVKLDVLGLKTLDTLSEWKKLVAEKGVDFDWWDADKTEWPYEMWDMLDKGYVAGIFQLETSAGKRLTEELKPRSVEDLELLVALNRPGPDSAEFIARRSGRKKITYRHPMLESVLESTYGLFVYQEQIIRFMGDLGYSLNDADAVRKILGKKQRQKLDDFYFGKGEWEDKGFLKVAMENGFTEKAALSIFDEIAEFASYSFNKSHAICYGTIALRCLIAKYYAPAEFYMACLRTLDKNKKAEMAPMYINEAHRLGVDILPPNIWESENTISVKDGKIYFGLSEVSGVAAGGKWIVEHRDEIDLSSPEALIEDIDRLTVKSLEDKKVAAANGQRTSWWKTPKQYVTDRKVEQLVKAGAWDSQIPRDVSMRQQQQLELETLGVILTDNVHKIEEAHADKIAECTPLAEASRSWYSKVEDEEATFTEYTVYGIITSIKPTKVKASGADMGIVTIEDGRDELTFAVFSREWKTHQFMFKLRNAGIFRIRHTAPTDKRSEGHHFREGFLLNE